MFLLYLDTLALSSVANKEVTFSWHTDRQLLLYINHHHFHRQCNHLQHKVCLPGKKQKSTGYLQFKTLGTLKLSFSQFSQFLPYCWQSYSSPWWPGWYYWWWWSWRWWLSSLISIKVRITQAVVLHFYMIIMYQCWWFSGISMFFFLDFNCQHFLSSESY